MEEFKKEVEKNLKMSFNVSYYLTDENKEIVRLFKEFCLKNTTDNYLAGISLLLSEYNRAAVLDELFNIVAELRAKIDSLESVSAPETTQKIVKTFGDRK